MRLEWVEKARADRERIFVFNLERSKSWATRVDDRLAARAEALRLTPFIGRPFGPRELRALSIPDIQYVIIYRADAKQVTILRVHNTRESREAE